MRSVLMANASWCKRLRRFYHRKQSQIAIGGLQLKTMTAQSISCHKPRSSCSGYVLLEALLSVVLLAIGLVGVIHAVKQSIRLVQYRKTWLAPAHALADSLLASLEIGFAPEILMASGITTGELGRFHYSIATAPWPAAPELRNVRVTVSWMEHGKAGELSLTTLLSVAEDRQSDKKIIERSVSTNSRQIFRQDENQQ